MNILSEQVAKQLVKLLADNRIYPHQWRHLIPQYITDENQYILANAKHLADGINESIEENAIGLPAHLMLDYFQGE
jgi:hypothetical protein